MMLNGSLTIGRNGFFQHFVTAKVYLSAINSYLCSPALLSRSIIGNTFEVCPGLTLVKTVLSCGGQTQIISSSVTTIPIYMIYNFSSWRPFAVKE